MNDARWFKLLIRAIGVLMLGLSIPRIGGVAGAVGMLFQGAPWTMYTPYSTTSGQGSWWDPMKVAVMVEAIANITQVAFGVYLICGAPRLVRYCIRQTGGRCPACDYDIRGLKGTCPECGLAIPPSARADS